MVKQEMVGDGVAIALRRRHGRRRHRRHRRHCCKFGNGTRKKKKNAGRPTL